MKSKLIREHRDNLVDFVERQLIGPGAMRSETGLEKFGVDQWNQGEVLDETAGSVYVTGILFPAKEPVTPEGSDSNVDGESGQTQVNDSVIDGAQQQDNSANTSGSEDHDEEEREISQRFPQSYGIAFCLDEGVLEDNDLKIVINARYYSKHEDISTAFVNVQDCDTELVKCLAENAEIGQYFNYKDNKLYLRISDKKEYPQINGLLKSVNRELCKSLTKDDESVKEREYYLSQYKEYLYDRRVSRPGNADAREKAKAKIQQIEDNERGLSYFADILSILNPDGYGFWKAEAIHHELDLSDIKLDIGPKYKEMYSPNDNASLHNFYEKPFSLKRKRKNDSGVAALSAWLQVVKDKRNPSNKNIYVKVIVENTSTKMKEEKGNLYSIVNESVNARSFFGIEIDASSKHISKYQEISKFSTKDEELERLNYTYRDEISFGVGNICSVCWQKEDEIMHVKSTFFPSHNLPDVSVTPQKYENDTLLPWVKETKYLEFKTLSTLSEETDESVLKGIQSFIGAYGEWIDTQEETNAEYAQTAKEIISGCKEDFNRIQRNIELLKDTDNMLAFRLMNTAMFMQLWHSNKANLSYLDSCHTRGVRKAPSVKYDFYKNLSGEVVKNGGKAAWRSFQLAFILLNLDGIIQDEQNDSDWNNRNQKVDLVWFPTGGGKTEAYLGLIALSIIVRRFRGHKGLEYGGGTTAIMRYTLRLLATQQFQRAMRLILALGVIQKWGIYNLGSEPISIGLYVGQSSLPNTVGGEEGLDKEASKWASHKPSKIPLEKDRCPWCGGILEYDNDNHSFTCSNNYCFSTGLPVLLSDEQVYKTPPTLLFGTVDKFAMLAHRVSDKKNKDSRRLLRDRNNTPDLIIQDELHLLSGPLGSAVALYECAIDQLCTKTRVINGREITVRPKVISSTATTRNTQHQIRALYGRDVNVFPKPGLKNSDSFFASYKRSKDNPKEYSSKRRYVGILPTGRTSMFTQLRLASCVLAYRAIYEDLHLSDFTGPNGSTFQSVADYFFTLISYFNSKKDVGTTDSQFSSEFPKYTRQVFQRVLRPDKMLNCHYTYNEAFRQAELTGRLNGEEVVDSLKDVGKSWDFITRDVHTIEKDAGEKVEVKGITPPDVVLATNMISVGLDVSRFSVMMVNSMPRNKAEYIQATSRVARDESGVVFTLHNPFRARDVSHFEQFVEFHQKLYYYVEPISITPFSTKTIEAFMPLYLATMIRHKISELSLDANVQSLTASLKNEIRDDAQQYFGRLAANTDFSEILNADTLAEIDTFICRALDEWDSKKGGLTKFSPTKFDVSALFVPQDSYEEHKESTLWVVPKSVRFIPTESVIKVKE